MHSKQKRFLLQIFCDDQKGFTIAKSNIVDMMRASQDMVLFMVRLNLMAKGTNSRIIATNLYKEKCFDKVTNLSIYWACLLKTGDNHCCNDPLQRTPSTKHRNIPVTGFYRKALIIPIFFSLFQKSVTRTIFSDSLLKLF